jgi:hypothetical protein
MRKRRNTSWIDECASASAVEGQPDALAEKAIWGALPRTTGCVWKPCACGLLFCFDAFDDNAIVKWTELHMGGFLPVRFRARAAHARMTGPLRAHCNPASEAAPWTPRTALQKRNADIRCAGCVNAGSRVRPGGQAEFLRIPLVLSGPSPPDLSHRCEYMCCSRFEPRRSPSWASCSSSMSNVEHLEASMRSFRSVTLALVFAAGPASTAAAQPPTPQPLHYWHVWVDSAGMTHQTQCEFKDFTVLGNPRRVRPERNL